MGDTDDWQCSQAACLDHYHDFARLPGWVIKEMFVYSWKFPSHALMKAAKPTVRALRMNKEVSSFYRTLSWLPPALPGRLQIDEALFHEPRALKRVTNCQLSEAALRRLSKFMRARPQRAAFLAPVDLTILSNANFELLAPVIEGAGLRYDLDLRVHLEPMGVVAEWAYQTRRDPEDDRKEIVVVAFTADHFERPSLVADAVGSSAFIDRTIADLVSVRREAAKRHATLFVQTVAASLMNVLGSIERNVPGTAANLIESFNHRVRTSQFLCVEIADLAGRIGIGDWSSQHYWHWAKLPFHPDNNLAYADALVRALAINRGWTKKCLVLDLDNTLWKGVIGDDGLEGIEIGNNSPVGEAHLAIQKFALTLRKRGILLAVCSKNDHDTAVLPFFRHAEMLLKSDDIAVFQANWTDKPSNLRAIAQTLSLGLDSFVFLDDNAMERDIVRRELPEISVPEVPGEDPSRWIELVSAAGYFDSYTFTETDKDRAEQYMANARRAQVQDTIGDMQAYLRELEMTLVVSPFTEDTYGRVAQLISRSNQFNLTTRRYSLEDVKSIAGRKDAVALSFRLRDKFGDNGIIAVMIGFISDQSLQIDTWLMSCRVLKRGVELACLVEFAKDAKALGAARLVGEYIPTAKNSMVAELYASLGFNGPRHGADVDAESSLWELDLKAAPVQDVIAVSRAA